MRTSESITKIAPALLKAQQAITFAAKTAQNPHLKNKYADLPAVIDAVKAALNDAGIVFIQTPGESSNEKLLVLTTRLLHESGEWIEDNATVPLPKADPQGYGSAMTYARRYSLAAICGLYQDDDDGNAASIGGSKPANDSRRDTKQSPLKKALHDCGATEQWLITMAEKAGWKGATVAAIEADKDWNAWAMENIEQRKVA
ncbi:ERF family protein [Aquitalea sp. USM4]|uniref:ERF family protein n=1 Tax=Aquitalea sp. USM4 TaxID=1590041 RepID=UPI001040623E|nr:ERF family protein [Aquitalea sp. USM4]QBJ80545.1 hypothetical protein DKK66_20075 [Aquitalea sp. USM4]